MFEKAVVVLSATTSAITSSVVKFAKSSQPHSVLTASASALAVDTACGHILHVKSQPH